MWDYWKMKIFFFCVFYTVSTLSHPKMKSCSFSIRSHFKQAFFLHCNHTVLLFPLENKPKPIFLLNQQHQLLKFITIFIFHVAVVNLMHRQKVRSYL